MSRTDDTTETLDAEAWLRQRSADSAITYAWTATISQGAGDPDTYHELAFMGMTVEQLDKWEPERRRRVIRYLVDRFGA